MRIVSSIAATQHSSLHISSGSTTDNAHIGEKVAREYLCCRFCHYNSSVVITKKNGNKAPPPLLPSFTPPLTLCVLFSPIFFNYNPKVLEFLQTWCFMARQATLSGKWFDHESLIGILHTFHAKESFNMKFLGPNYCVWPGQENEDSVIVMGLADVNSKKESLRKLGMAENVIEWQSPGTK